MFQWYKQAAVCYVTLMDLQPRALLKIELPRCRWFTRGWTLQELLAPEIMEFYDAAGTCIGNKHTLARELSSITRIARPYLRNGDLASISVATKMSWVARRETKRVEDMAYSMLGIFDVNMPLIYGEGKKAFRRLQEEIIKRNNDLSIFAWVTRRATDALHPRVISPLAPSPAAFEWSNISSYSQDFAEFSLTNKGLLLSGDVSLRTTEVTVNNGDQTLYIILLGEVTSMRGSSTATDGVMVLRKIGPKLFCRDGCFGIATDLRVLRFLEVTETCILLDTNAATRGALEYRTDGLHVPVDLFTKLYYARPEALWDVNDRIFLKPQRYNWDGYPMVLCMMFDVLLAHGNVSLVVLCHHPLGDGRALKIFTPAQYPELDIVFNETYREKGIHVAELERHAPSFQRLDSTTRVKDGNQYRQISVFLRPILLQTFAGYVGVSAMSFSIDGKDTKDMH
jgi:hypothetical protein